jgi:hypothetical protein
MIAPYPLFVAFAYSLTDNPRSVIPSNKLFQNSGFLNLAAFIASFLRFIAPLAIALPLYYYQINRSTDQQINAPIPLSLAHRPGRPSSPPGIRCTPAHVVESPLHPQTQ